MERAVERTFLARPTMEGAGVRLKRVFGFHDIPALDPFLLLDHFGSEDPEDYVAGFPWHPHRGIETVTYMINGVVAHGDSLGNQGVIRSGEIQWMTAGSGIIHQEMPEPSPSAMVGFQLWVNLPGSHKMMAPRYRGIAAAEVPLLTSAEGARIKVIAGRYGDIRGPAIDLVVPCTYLDIELNHGATFECATSPQDTVIGYVFEGAARFGEKSARPTLSGSLALLSRGDHVCVRPDGDHARFILVNGRPLHEPISWGGPIVMNNQEELDAAFEEYRNGTFLRHAPAQTLKG